MSLIEFAQVCDKISNTSSKKEKVRILADYLKPLDDQSLEIASLFLTGLVFPKGSSLDLNLGYNNLWSILVSITNMREDELDEAYIRYGDLGSVAELALKNPKVKPLVKIDLDLKYIYNAFKKIAEIKGSGAIEEKWKILEGLLINSSPLEAKYLVKVILNELRIGLSEGLLEEAIAEAFDQSLDKVRRSILLNGDIGYIALSAKHGRLEHIKMEVFKPVSFMLADTVESLDIKDEMIVEYKYDGIRAQLHKSNGIKIFSRRLEDITDSFPELDIKTDHQFILDGEIIAYNNKPLPFNQLQKRLRKKHIDNSIPIKYLVYDILYLDGSMLIDKSLRERKKILEQLDLDGYMLSPYIITSSEDKIMEMYNESKKLGHEGLMLKDPNSHYQIGKRGKHWLKLKHALDTLDVVIVAAEYGHGKRATLLSDYTFAVKDNDRLKVIGKAYSGLRDDEIKEVTERLKELAIRDEGYRVIVKPEIVLEVAFDDIAISDRYDSNFALRFPRIKSIRYDKSIDDIDTLDKIKRLYNSKR